MFVGSNNSGKSRFLRMLSAQVSFEMHRRDVDLGQVNQAISRSLSVIKDGLLTQNLSAVNDIELSAINTLEKTLPATLRTDADVYLPFRTAFENWVNISSINRTQSSIMGSSRRVEDLVPIIRDASTEALAALSKIPAHTKEDNPKKVYVPIVRGLRPLDAEHTDFYHTRTINDYFEPTSQGITPEIFTGLDLYKSIKEALLGSNAERKKIARYQEFISKALFEGREVTLIPSLNSKVIEVKIGNEMERPIHFLGDGIQSAIILSYLPFMRDEPTFFFIEEPEVHLHPGMQRKLLEYFALRDKHSFFLTTHSNHLLDITLDIKEATIFTFRKEIPSDGDDVSASYTVENVDSGHSSSLELLGVRNSSVFLVNATIWVEGITDRLYLREYLKSYISHLEKGNDPQRRMEEDVHYCFVEYGGSNITHWSFLEVEENPIEVQRLCSRAFLIIDKDGESKLERKEELAEKLGENLCILPCREIENLLPPDVIIAVVKGYEKAPDLSLPEFEYSSYQDEYLGTFVEDTLLNGNRKRRGSYKANSGTIEGKVDFCNRATDEIRNLNYVDLPEYTKEVVEKIGFVA